jgi:hypothetical protein
MKRYLDGRGPGTLDTLQADLAPRMPHRSLERPVSACGRREQEAARRTSGEDKTTSHAL